MAKGKLTDKDDKDINDILKIFDKDKNGFISEKEMKIGLAVFFGDNYTPSELNQIYVDMDHTKGEKIPADKFRSFLKKYIEESKRKTREEKKAEYEAAFRVFDKDKSDYLDKRELATFLKQHGDPMTDKEIEQMFKMCDTNKDGKISRKEYVELFLKDYKEPAKQKKNSKT